MSITGFQILMGIAKIYFAIVMQIRYRFSIPAKLFYSWPSHYFLEKEITIIPIKCWRILFVDGLEPKNIH